MRIKYIAIFASFVLLIPIIVNALAQLEKSEKQEKLLDSAMAHVWCKTNFNKNVIQSIVSHAGNFENLTALSTKLQDETAKLQAIADTGNLSEFRNYSKGTYDKSLKATRIAIKEARLSIKNNTIKSAIREDYSRYQKELRNCSFAAIKKHAHGKLDMFNADLQRHQAEADRLALKGININALNAVIQDARTQIVEPLKAVINNANSLEEINSAMKQYCMYNGCRNGKNFHLAARWSIAKLSSILDYLEPNATSGNLSDKVTKARESLNAAKVALDKVGLAPWSQYPKLHAEVWSNIAEASRTIKLIRKALI